MAVLMQGDHHVPVGFRFRPNEEELLCFYLRSKINGERFPNGLVHNCNVYGDQEPWHVWEAYKDPLDQETKELYFFTDQPKKMRSITIRRVGTGTWRGENTGKKVHASGSGRVIGSRTRFMYKKPGSVQDGRWLLHELELDESLLHSKDQVKEKRYVLCILRKIEEKKDRKRSGRDEWGQ